jgi:alanine racemase
MEGETMRNEDKRTWAEIDLHRLEHNYREIRRALPEGCRFAGLCKANAYGHGAVTIARRLEELGADYIAVSCYEEAAELRAAGLEMPILILAPSPAFLAPDIARLGAEQAIGDIDCARGMSRALAGTGLTLRCHIKLETGMGRTGFSVSSERELDGVRELLRLPGLESAGVFTHFAVSDEPEESFTLEQFGRFTAAVDALENETGRSLGIRHCANSGAVVNFRQTCLDMVRPGLLLYGLYPGAERGGLDLKPVMRLLTRVAEVTEHRAGDTISYGRIYTCERDMRLAVIPVGYADGLHRSLSGKFDVVINGRRARQVGRICMDMCMVDVTDMPEVRAGDIVTVFGDEPDAGELADIAGTISYELLCAISPRVPRVYIGL